MVTSSRIAIIIICYPKNDHFSRTFSVRLINLWIRERMSFNTNNPALSVETIKPCHLDFFASGSNFCSGSLKRNPTRALDCTSDYCCHRAGLAYYVSRNRAFKECHAPPLYNSVKWTSSRKAPSPNPKWVRSKWAYLNNDGIMETQWHKYNKDPRTNIFQKSK